MAPRIASPYPTVDLDHAAPGIRAIMFGFSSMEWHNSLRQCAHNRHGRRIAVTLQFASRHLEPPVEQVGVMLTLTAFHRLAQ